jgi:hypothetical protein
LKKYPDKNLNIIRMVMNWSDKKISITPVIENNGISLKNNNTKVFQAI